MWVAPRELHSGRKGAIPPECCDIVAITQLRRIQFLVTISGDQVHERRIQTNNNSDMQMRAAFVHIHVQGHLIFKFIQIVRLWNIEISIILLKFTDRVKFFPKKCKSLPWREWQGKAHVIFVCYNIFIVSASFWFFLEKRLNGDLTSGAIHSSSSEKRRSNGGHRSAVDVLCAEGLGFVSLDKWNKCVVCPVLTWPFMKCSRAVFLFCRFSRMFHLSTTWTQFTLRLIDLQFLITRSPKFA